MQKYVRENEGHFMAKKLREQIAFKKQRTIYLQLLHKNKKSYYDQLDPKVFRDKR